MRIWIVAAVVLALPLSFAACGGDGAGGGGGGVAGTYKLDMDSMAKDARAMVEQAMKEQGMDMSKLPDELKATMKQTIDEQVEMMKSMNISVTLKGDGTYQGSMQAEGDAEQLGGTWTKSGDTITFTDSKDEGNSAVGTYSNGTLTVTPSGSPMSFKLKK